MLGRLPVLEVERCERINVGRDCASFGCIEKGDVWPDIIIDVGEIGGLEVPRGNSSSASAVGECAAEDHVVCKGLSCASDRTRFAGLDLC